MNQVTMIQDLLMAIGYFLGSIPFGLILTKAAGLGDIRKVGSGNIGATNVMRTGNKALAALTLLLDGVKGAVAVLIAQHFDPNMESFAGIAALLGHIFPVWLNFKGGKGVATGVGVITALLWPVGTLIMVTWTLTAVLGGYSSLAALIAFGLAPLFAMVTEHGERLWLTVIIMMIIVFTHRANIRRLLDGTEPKIKQK